MLTEFAYKLQTLLDRYRPQRLLDVYGNPDVKPKGHVLVSYMPLPVMGDAGHFRGHSNVWESAEIVRIFNLLGYAVDVIQWRDQQFIPRKEYAAVFDIHMNLLRYAQGKARTIFHVTGSHPVFSNQAERERLAALRERRGATLKPRRDVTEEDLRVFSENLEQADLVTLIGNKVTAATFAPHVRHKMWRVIATGSYLPWRRDAGTAEIRREFLWFNGSGAVHKGLDLVLEVFARNPRLTLHVVGPYGKERDFVEAYRRELFGCPNIHSHGFLYPASRKFQRIATQSIAFVNPTCSEGISTSAITCMQCGLIPLLSLHAGISPPPGSGIVLPNCSLDVIEEAVRTLADKSAPELREMMATTQAFALATYGRAAFSTAMTEALQRALDGRVVNGEEHDL